MRLPYVILVGAAVNRLGGQIDQPAAPHQGVGGHNVDGGGGVAHHLLLGPAPIEVFVAGPGKDGDIGADAVEDILDALVLVGKVEFFKHPLMDGGFAPLAC